MVCSLGKTRSKEKIGGGSEDMIKKKKQYIFESQWIKNN